MPAKEAIKTVVHLHLASWRELAGGKPLDGQEPAGEASPLGVPRGRSPPLTPPNFSSPCSEKDHSSPSHSPSLCIEMDGRV